MSTEEIYQNNLSNMLSALGKVSKEYSILIQQENLASTKKFLEAGERFDSKIKEMQESVFNEQWVNISDSFMWISEKMILAKKIIKMAMTIGNKKIIVRYQTIIM